MSDKKVNKELTVIPVKKTTEKTVKEPSVVLNKEPTKVVVSKIDAKIKNPELSEDIKEIDEKDAYDKSMDGIEELDQKSDTLKILELMLDSKNNLKLKSEVKRPLQFSALFSKAEWIKEKGMHKSSYRIQSFIKTTLELYISYHRQGRKEIIDAIRTSGPEVSMQDNTLRV